MLVVTGFAEVVAVVVTTAGRVACDDDSVSVVVVSASAVVLGGRGELLVSNSSPVGVVFVVVAIVCWLVFVVPTLALVLVPGLQLGSKLDPMVGATAFRQRACTPSPERNSPTSESLFTFTPSQSAITLAPMDLSARMQSAEQGTPSSKSEGWQLGIWAV